MHKGAALGCAMAVLMGAQAALADHCGGQQTSEQLSACLREHLGSRPPTVNPPAHEAIMADPTAVVPPVLDRESPALILRENLLRERIGP